MTAISSKTRAEIKGYLEGFIKGLIDEYKGRKILKPILQKLNFKNKITNLPYFFVLMVVLTCGTIRSFSLFYL